MWILDILKITRKFILHLNVHNVKMWKIQNCFCNSEIETFALKLSTICAPNSKKNKLVCYLLTKKNGNISNFYIFCHLCYESKFVCWVIVALSIYKFITIRKTWYYFDLIYIFNWIKDNYAQNFLVSSTEFFNLVWFMALF